MKTVRLNKSQTARYRANRFALVDAETGEFARYATEQESRDFTAHRQQNKVIRVREKGKILNFRPDRERLREELIAEHGCSVRTVWPNNVQQMVARMHVPMVQHDAPRKAPHPSRCQCSEWEGRPDGKHHPHCPMNKLADDEHRSDLTDPFIEDGQVRGGTDTGDTVTKPAAPKSDVDAPKPTDISPRRPVELLHDPVTGEGIYGQRGEDDPLCADCVWLGEEFDTRGRTTCPHSPKGTHPQSLAEHSGCRGERFEARGSETFKDVEVGPEPEDHPDTLPPAAELVVEDPPVAPGDCECKSWRRPAGADATQHHPACPMDVPWRDHQAGVKPAFLYTVQDGRLCRRATPDERVEAQRRLEDPKVGAPTVVVGGVEFMVLEEAP